jgi:hypothetical protein
VSKGRRALRYSSEADMPEGMRRLLRPAQASSTPAVQLPTPAAAPARHARHTAGEMNNTERAYSQVLALRQAAGEILWFGFEKVKLRLAKATYLTVDFFVLVPGGIECHEVKGRTSGDKFWAEEDARIKLKVAAELFPFRFVVVWPKKGGGWHDATIGGARC